MLAGFQHRPGVHCGSTALSDALRVGGLDLSEHMVFGLGAGLGFYYLTGPSLNPTHTLFGRHLRLEQTVCEVLGARLTDRTEDDPGRAWDGAAQALERGVAPILITDLRHLPYAGTRTPFNWHSVVLAGYDPDRRVAFLADTEREGLCEVSFEDLEQARASDGPPFGYTGRHWMEVEAPSRPRPLAEAIADALHRQAREMLLETSGVAGVAGLDRFAEELPAWSRRVSGEADRSWCFRFAYQVIERRGTGGGLFRALYARFLEEAERLVPSLARLGLSARMRELAERWTTLAQAFKALSEAPGAGAPPPVVGIAGDVARGERRFFEEVAALVP
jgi:hypothetical protein